MTSPIERTFEGFSLSHAAILDGTTGAEEADFYGVRTASLAPDTGSFDNTGDDSVLSSWFWFNFATVTVESGFISWDVMELLSGTPTRTVAQTGDETPIALPEGNRYEMPLWDIDSANQAARPMVIRMPSKDADGNVRTMDIVLYKVIFSPISFTGPAYKDGLTASWTGRAVLSNRDETGALLTPGNPTATPAVPANPNGIKRAVGRLINRPV
jgi:hypothetical protein